MGKVNLSANLEAAKDAGLVGGGSFKLKEGDNRVRIVQGFLPHDSEFTDAKGVTKSTFKWLTRVLDRRDGKIKVFFMGHTIYKQLVEFQQDSESGTDFDEVPMPYDINIKAVGAGTMLAKYTVIPGKRSPLSLAESAMLSDEEALEDTQEALRKKQPPRTTVHFDPDEIPA